MKRMRFVLMLGAAATLLAVGAQAAPPEWPAGTVLDDGTVAGERQALDYLRDQEPKIYKRIMKLEPEEMRARMRSVYGKFFVWFQRVGNYRKKQKKEMLLQIRQEIRLRSLASDYQRTDSSRKKKDIRERMRAGLTDQFESETGLLEYKVRGLQESFDHVKKSIEILEGKVRTRRKAKNKLIDTRLKKLIDES